MFSNVVKDAQDSLPKDLRIGPQVQMRKVRNNKSRNVIFSDDIDTCDGDYGSVQSGTDSKEAFEEDEFNYCLKEGLETKQISRIKDLGYSIAKQIGRRKSYHMKNVKSGRRESTKNGSYVGLPKIDDIKIPRLFDERLEGKPGDALTAHSCKSPKIQASLVVNRSNNQRFAMNQKTTVLPNIANPTSTNLVQKHGYKQARNFQNRNNFERNRSIKTQETFWNLTKNTEDMHSSKARSVITLPRLDSDFKKRSKSKPNHKPMPRPSAVHNGTVVDFCLPTSSANAKANAFANGGSGSVATDSINAIGPKMSARKSVPAIFPCLNHQQQQQQNNIDKITHAPSLDYGCSARRFLKPTNATQRFIVQQIMVKGYGEQEHEVNQNTPTQKVDEFHDNRRLSQVFRELALCRYLRK
eukprot:gene620-1283_t